ncbi:chloramphenicol hydrolase [Novosphingobium sp.]|uniref:chloramphenicol hydrolase n=1 Tax=Novosphingobium sp. TaxID=1874826 RepID=UPI003342656E
MTLNPQVEALLGMFAQMPPVDLATITAPEMRAANDRPMAMGPPPEVAQVRDLSIDLPGRTLAARLYVPADAGENPPLLVYYHGGGWVVGTIDTHDGTCRAIARASGAAVLSVGYRLAPEAPFPASLDDCHDALVWAHDHAADLGIDATRLAVAGDSAGGNLAAAVAIRVRDHGGPALRHQLLIYPVTDTDFTRASYGENGAGNYFLSTAMMEWFWQQYIGDLAQGHVDGATVLHTGDLAGLPSATVIMAEYDPLRDEGVAYAERLSAAGNPVHAEVAPGMIHGFFSMFEFVTDALPHIDAAGARLRAALA